MAGKKGQIPITVAFLVTINQHLVCTQLPDSKGENCGHEHKIVFQYLREWHPGRSEGALANGADVNERGNTANDKSDSGS